MKFNILKICLCGIICTFGLQASSLKKETVSSSAQDYFSTAVEAFEAKDWKGLLTSSQILVKNFITSPFGQEAQYFMGISYFNLKEYELANKHFSKYLKNQATPKHFEEAIEYKFAIAELYKGGEKKHIMGFEKLPKWIPAKEDAIRIYDEVVTALPHHDLGAQALFGKASLLFKDKEYKSGIEAFQTLIRRFPKHPLSAESYVRIGEIYLAECINEYPDPDFLDLALINLRKFKMDFPSDDKVEIAEKNLLGMKEIYAQSLYETAQFYERTKKPNASLIYYSQIAAKYPETKLATIATKRLDVIVAQVRKDKNKTSALAKGKNAAEKKPEEPLINPHGSPNEISSFQNSEEPSLKQ